MAKQPRTFDKLEVLIKCHLIAEDHALITSAPSRVEDVVELNAAGVVAEASLRVINGEDGSAGVARRSIGVDSVGRLVREWIRDESEVLPVLCYALDTPTVSVGDEEGCCAVIER